MKKFRLLVLAFAAMLAGTQNGVAQDWPGHTPDDLLNKTGEDAEVYLWNVGTGQFLYSGGLWGTQAITYDTGTPFTVKSPVNGDEPGWWDSSFYCSLESPFQANNQATYLSLTDGTDASSKHDDGIWFVDRNTSQATTVNKTTVDLLTLRLRPVSSGSKTYNICSEPSGGGFRGQSVYMVATGRNGVVSSSTTRDTSDPNAQWILVTLAEIRANFSNGTADAADARRLDATYILYDQNFMRNNTDITNWHYGDVSATNSNHLNNDYSDLNYDNNKNKKLLPTNNTLTYYVGYGYHPNDASYENLYRDDDVTALVEGESHAKLYGQYYTANIKGTGTIWQLVRTQVKYKGWYVLSCNGFTTDNNNNVEMFATTYRDVNLTQKINEATTTFSTVTATDDVPETYVEAGRLLQDGTTQKQLRIYIDPTESAPYLVIGIRVKSGAASDTWTCVDNFMLQYVGDPNEYILLDEGRSDLEYINSQLDSQKSYMLCLKRSFVNDGWNSLILPVNLTAGQLKYAFGGNVKLSVKDESPSDNDNVIRFESVDLSNKGDNEVVLTAGVPYIIKPSYLRLGTELDGQVLEIRGMDGQANNTVTLDKDTYITIAQVTLNNKVVDDFVKVGPFSCGDAGQMNFMGTYTKQDAAIVKDSYLLSGGEWYHTNVTLDTVKGFRTWLAPANGQSTNGLIFAVDGVIEGELTDIDGIEAETGVAADGKVYNLNGQAVNNNGSLDGLPKGIYIVNGKKYVVK